MKKVIKVAFRKLFVIRLFLTLAFVSLPLQANAGVLSFVTGLFDSISEEKSIFDNSQNMELLQASISISSSSAKGGGDITIVEDTALMPEVGPSGSSADLSEELNDKISVYVVRKGDSLSQIAKMFSVTSNTIIWANDLKKGSVKEGQTLVILPVSGVRHTVAKGETLSSIAKKYKGDIDEIVQFNDLSSDSELAIGDVVIIPDGEIGTYDSGTKKSSSSKSVARGTSGPSYSGYYISPASGKKSQGLHGYNAIDIAASVGTPIVASASGKIIVSKDYGWNGGYGNYIVVQHDNGTQTLYAHTSENIVSVGQGVVQGQVIGYVGNTGKSTGPHLHFEIRGAKNPF